MSLKETMKSAIGVMGQAAWLAPVFERPSVRRALERVPGGKSLYDGGWRRRHPFDRLNGTDTSGMVPAGEMDIVPAQPGGAPCYGGSCYAGSQPGVLRAVLRQLPSLDGYSFLDLGCGKGRPLFVAAEFPFREITGVEISPQIAAIAGYNAAIMRRRHPRRTPVRIVTGDAAAFPLPAGDFVLLLYNPFGRALIRKVVRNVEAAIAAQRRRIYVVYYNPVLGEYLDASRMLHRYFSETLPYADDELGYGPDEADTVVIWEAGDGPPLPGTDARIVVTIPEMRCELGWETPAPSPLPQ